MRTPVPPPVVSPCQWRIENFSTLQSGVGLLRDRHLYLVGTPATTACRARRLSDSGGLTVGALERSRTVRRARPRKTATCWSSWTALGQHGHGDLSVFLDNLVFLLVFLDLQVPATRFQPQFQPPLPRHPSPSNHHQPADRTLLQDTPSGSQRACCLCGGREDAHTPQAHAHTPLMGGAAEEEACFSEGISFRTGLLVHLGEVSQSSARGRCAPPSAAAAATAETPAGWAARQTGPTASPRRALSVHVSE
jgi:hypothetical protein